MGRIWAVCSGSGGVGKSMIALSLAAGAARGGKRVVLLDASGAARSCDLSLGLESVVVLDMADILGQQASLDAALYPSARYAGLRLACASLDDSLPTTELAGIVLALHSVCDVLVIDLPTGEMEIGRGILREGDERILVVRPDAASVRAAERIMLRCGDDRAGLSLVVNRASRERVKHGIQYTLEAVQNVLDRAALACIPEDASIPASEQKGRAAIECGGPAKAELNTLIKALLSCA